MRRTIHCVNCKTCTRNLSVFIPYLCLFLVCRSSKYLHVLVHPGIKLHNKTFFFLLLFQLCFCSVPTPHYVYIYSQRIVRHTASDMTMWIYIVVACCMHVACCAFIVALVSVCHLYRVLLFCVCLGLGASSPTITTNIYSFVFLFVFFLYFEFEYKFYFMMCTYCHRQLFDRIEWMDCWFNVACVCACEEHATPDACVCVFVRIYVI